jgi:ATP-binding cassette subfamily F protein 3
VRVLSGGERTRLAVARMLLQPSNTLLLDEPTNHLDLDSKEVLLDALIDYGGTLIFVSHDRYFVEGLATKIIEVGDGEVVVYPGTYKEFLWHKEHPAGQEGRERQEGRQAPAAMSARKRESAPRALASAGAPREDKKSRDGDAARFPSHEQKKRADADTRRREKAVKARRARIDELEGRIANCENAIREIERAMSAPGFYDDRAAAQPVIDRHQTLMWEVGDLMHQWEELQAAADLATISGV